jgi:hypothetical protein
MLYIIATKSVEPMLYTMAQKVYNIENDVIHYWHYKCITSKTMLYTMSQKVYNIENDVIHYCHNKCITSKTMLYTIGTNRTDVIHYGTKIV